MADFPIPRPPKSLKRRGRQLWRDVLTGWEIHPEQHELLQNLCESHDFCDELRQILAREGPVVKDRFGVLKPHPAATILKGEVASFTALYRALALEVPGGDDIRAGRRDGFQPET
jgi:hypothetical protein